MSSELKERLLEIGKLANRFAADCDHMATSTVYTEMVALAAAINAFPGLAKIVRNGHVPAESVVEIKIEGSPTDLSDHKHALLKKMFHSGGLVGSGQGSLEGEPHQIKAMQEACKHSHYFKDVRHLTDIDVYRVCDIFKVNDPSGATQHAIKKLLLPGARGAGKSMEKDLSEARDTIERRLKMLVEDREVEKV